MLPTSVLCVVTCVEGAKMFSFSGALNVPLSPEAHQEVIRRLDADQESSDLTRELMETSQRADLLAKADISAFALTGSMTPECIESQLKTAELDEKIVGLLLKRAKRAGKVIVQAREDYAAKGTLG